MTKRRCSAFDIRVSVFVISGIPMPRVVKHSEAAVSAVRLPGGRALYAVYLTRDDFRAPVHGFGVRSLDAGVTIDIAEVGEVDEVLFIVSGTGVVLAGEAELPVQPGDVVLTPAGDRRGIRNTGLEPLVFAGFAAEVKE
jgi:glyoxylate utilization-related uncharacterized protein